MVATPAYPKKYSLAGPAPLAPQHRVWMASERKFIEPSVGVYTVYSKAEEETLLKAIPHGLYPEDSPELAASSPMKPDPTTGWMTPSTAARLAHRLLMPIASELDRRGGLT